MVEITGRFLALFGILNWVTFHLVLADPIGQIGKFLEDKEEEEQETQTCAYFWEIDEPIKLDSCV